MLSNRSEFAVSGLGEQARGGKAVETLSGPVHRRPGGKGVTVGSPGESSGIAAHSHYHFSVTAGTIMHDSHLPLRKWFAAIYLMCESKKGMSANQLHRTLGVAYRTAWYLCHRIREAMGNDPLSGPTLVGVVEVDETLVGGKVKGKGRRYTGNKTIVAGAIQRERRGSPRAHPRCEEENTP